MDEKWLKLIGIFGGGAIGIVFILVLTKMFNAPPFRKNGNGKSIMEEIMVIGQTMATNSALQTQLLREIHETNKDNGRMLNSLSSNLALAMERQLAASRKIDELGR